MKRAGITAHPSPSKGSTMAVRSQATVGAAHDGSGKLTKENWLDLAIETLITGGIDQVKIQVMAKKFGVSRSSFYWFFDSIQDLQDQILAYWLSKNTGPIIERAMRPAATVNKAVCNIFECWIDNSLFEPDLDLAIRFWGRHDPRIRSIVDEADRQRVEAVTRMFERYRFPQEEANTRARVLYYTQIGHFTLQVRETLAERYSHLRSYLVTFTGVEPTPADMEDLRTSMATD